MASPASYGDLANLRLLMMSGAAASDSQAGDEAALVRQAKAGDLAAFEQLISLHERQVYQTTVRLLHRSADAPDACQEVFLRFYKHLHRLDERRPCAPWLYRITVNVCHGINRQRRKLPSLSLDDPATTGISLQTAHSPTDPLQQASGAEQERLLIFHRPIVAGLQINLDVERNRLLELRAPHGLLLDKSSQRSFSLTRARLICERTVVWEEPRILATSRVESPSRSRNTSAARSFCGNRFSASPISTNAPSAAGSPISWAKTSARSRPSTAGPSRLPRYAKSGLGCSSASKPKAANHPAGPAGCC